MSDTTSGRNVRPQLLSNNNFVHNNNAATAINHGNVQSFIGGIDSQLLRGTSKATRRSYDCDGQQDCTRKFPHEECPVRGQIPTSLQGASPADIDLRVGECCCVGNESVMLLASLLIMAIPVQNRTRPMLWLLYKMIGRRTDTLSSWTSRLIAWIQGHDLKQSHANGIVEMFNQTSQQAVYTSTECIDLVRLYGQTTGLNSPTHFHLASQQNIAQVYAAFESRQTYTDVTDLHVHVLGDMTYDALCAPLRTVHRLGHVYLYAEGQVPALTLNQFFSTEDRCCSVTLVSYGNEFPILKVLPFLADITEDDLRTALIQFAPALLAQLSHVTPSLKLINLDHTVQDPSFDTWVQMTPQRAAIWKLNTALSELFVAWVGHEPLWHFAIVRPVLSLNDVRVIYLTYSENLSAGFHCLRVTHLVTHARIMFRMQLIHVKPTSLYVRKTASISNNVIASSKDFSRYIAASDWTSGTFEGMQCDESLNNYLTSSWWLS